MLPGGDAVLFTVVVAGSGAATHGDVAVHSLSSGKRRIIVRGGIEARYVSDGYLVYGVQNALMAVAFDAGRLTTVGEAVPIAQDVERPFGICSWGHPLRGRPTTGCSSTSQMPLRLGRSAG